MKTNKPDSQKTFTEKRLLIKNEYITIVIYTTLRRPEMEAFLAP